jgi:predicted flavoprotein YhiN
MFPVSNSSQTIIDCFLQHENWHKKYSQGQSVQSIFKENVENRTQNEKLCTGKLVVATGVTILEMLQTCRHSL